MHVGGIDTTIIGEVVHKLLIPANVVKVIAAVGDGLQVGDIADVVFNDFDQIRRLAGGDARGQLRVILAISVFRVMPVFFSNASTAPLYAVWCRSSQKKKVRVVPFSSAGIFARNWSGVSEVAAPVVVVVSGFLVVVSGFLVVVPFALVVVAVEPLPWVSEPVDSPAISVSLVPVSAVVSAVESVVAMLVSVCGVLLPPQAVARVRILTARAKQSRRFDFCIVQHSFFNL